MSPFVRMATPLDFEPWPVASVSSLSISIASRDLIGFCERRLKTAPEFKQASPALVCAGLGIMIGYALIRLEEAGEAKHAGKSTVGTRDVDLVIMDLGANLQVGQWRPN